MIKYVDRETFLRLCEATLKSFYSIPSNAEFAPESVIESCWKAAQKFEELANKKY